MQLPQELIDVVIDLVSVLGDRKSTLLSCALVSRAFASPSQRKLFTTVHLHGISNHKQFALLLSSSPHIGFFVRTFRAEYDADPHTSYPILIAKILAALPCLKVLRRVSPGMQPSDIRRIELGKQVFADAMELESLLANSTGLRELCLESISFKSHRVVRVPRIRRISLERMEFTLMLMGEATIQCILDALTIVDVKHLRSLRFELAVVRPILGVNAGSLQEVEIKYNDKLFVVGETFRGQSKLRSIRLDARYGEEFGQIVASLGQLSDLRRLIMHVRDEGAWTSDNEAGWAAVDHALSATQDLRNLEEIQIIVRYDIWSNSVKLDLRFPLLAQRGLLHVFRISFGY
ncbi:hypothetical protein C8R47DRAFT_12600 [Mycena vitilis]|nr:hypothetical protein C8R47DRAFT_12600 [Mycena vitilis]